MIPVTNFRLFANKNGLKSKIYINLPLINNINKKIVVKFASDFIHDKAFINDEWVSGKSGKAFNVINPATAKVIATVPNLEVDDVKIAITSAREAFPGWSDVTAVERGDILCKIEHLMEENISDLAKIITVETGKTISESLTEIKYSASFLKWFSEQAKRVDGEIYQSPINNRIMLSIKQPIGVIALVTPWNFPLSMILRKASAALAVGCTCIIKPSEFTPLTALAFADVAKRGGLPKGVINVVTSDFENSKQVGKLICESPLVDGLSFTGSTEVGKILYRQSASTVKRISLELGGNAPFIVFKSANLKDAVVGGFASRFRNSGQACVSANRFFIQEEVYDKFIDLMATKMNSLKLGNGLVPGVNIGPLTTLKQVQKVDEIVKDAISKGAKLHKGGERNLEKGEYFYEPTLLSEIKPSMLCFTEEIFGPVVACTKFKTEDEVIKISNGTRKGLAGYFYSNNLPQIYRAAKRMEVGMVGVNSGSISSVQAPFGGVKESGLGREACYYGMNEFLNIKYICIAGIN